MDSGFGTVFLKRKEGIPDLGILEADLTGVIVVFAALEVVIKDFKKRFEINKLWGVIFVEFFEIGEDFLFDIFGITALPDVVKPCFEVIKVVGFTDGEVEFDIGGSTKAKAANREIRATEEGVLFAGLFDMVELAVEEVGFFDRADLYFLFYPCSAFTGGFFLLEGLCNLEPVL